MLTSTIQLKVKTVIKPIRSLFTTQYTLHLQEMLVESWIVGKGLSLTKHTQS